MKEEAPAAAALVSDSTLRNIIKTTITDRGLRALVEESPDHNVCPLCKLWQARINLCHELKQRAHRQQQQQQQQQQRAPTTTTTTMAPTAPTAPTMAPTTTATTTAAPPDQLSTSPRPRKGNYGQRGGGRAATAAGGITPIKCKSRYVYICIYNLAGVGCGAPDHWVRLIM